MKECRKCNRLLSVTEFCNEKATPDGLSRWCRDCKKDYKKQWNNENKDRIKNYTKEYYDNKVGCLREKSRRKYWNDPEASKKAHLIWIRNNPDKRKEYRSNYDNKYPEKKKARKAVEHALRNGTLEKQPCEVCGEIRVQGHHEDYSTPLKVIWLCSQCHSDRHRQTKDNEECQNSELTKR